MVPESIVVDYEYVRNSIADCNKLIVDVREPEEIKEHGKIPNSINIPCKPFSIILFNHIAALQE